jgi:hypothetical protein
MSSRGSWAGFAGVLLLFNTTHAISAMRIAAKTIAMITGQALVRFRVMTTWL